jgi:hypothetical protein
LKVETLGKNISGFTALLGKFLFIEQNRPQIKTRRKGKESDKNKNGRYIYIERGREKERENYEDPTARIRPPLPAVGWPPKKQQEENGKTPRK